MDLLMAHVLVTGRMPTWEDLAFYTVVLSLLCAGLIYVANKRPSKRKRIKRRKTR